jgi:hypothetical protein
MAEFASFEHTPTPRVDPGEKDFVRAYEPKDRDTVEQLIGQSIMEAQAQANNWGECRYRTAADREGARKLRGRWSLWE